MPRAATAYISNLSPQLLSTYMMFILLTSLLLPPHGPVSATVSTQGEYTSVLKTIPIHLQSTLLCTKSFSPSTYLPNRIDASTPAIPTPVMEYTSSAPTPPLYVATSYLSTVSFYTPLQQPISSRRGRHNSPIPTIEDAEVGVIIY